MSLLSVKEEPEESECDVSEAEVRAGLYAEHEVKNELVLGPVLLQMPDMAYKFHGQHKPSPDVKQEPIDTSDSFSNSILSIDKPVKELKVEPKWEEEQENLDRVHDQVKQELSETQQDFVTNGLSPKYEIKTIPETENHGNNEVLLKLESDEDEKKTYKTRKQTRISSRLRIRFEDDSEMDSDTEINAIDTDYLEEQKPKRKKIHKCPYCGKQFNFRTGLTNHIRTHTGEKPYSCKICSKKFSDYAVLIRHRKVHTGLKPHVCKTCGNSFSEKYLLKNHMRVHTGEQIYFCSDCPKSFINSSNYRRHQKVHKHKYTCDICKRKFRNKSMLVSHIVSHMKPTPYVCVFCEKCFSHSGNLNRHIMVVHGGRKRGCTSYTCGVCKTEFTQLGSLKKHVARRVCEKRKMVRKC